MAKMTKSSAASGPPKPYYCVLNQNKPDKAYTTERAKKTGKANACSGKIFVTVAPDHFGPILAENDPERGTGVLVGETWEDRMECRQWGAHLPHVAGISGQSDYGAQSVALSGGYEDDEDHGEWFLYKEGTDHLGGRDLSGNKRTNKTQSFDQRFDKYNEALRVSCRKGYPVRVVRTVENTVYTMEISQDGIIVQESSALVKSQMSQFCCLICHKVMTLPLTTPCAHNFCKSCLQDTFEGQTFMRERTCDGRRTLRAKKNIMKCPSCSNDISEYLQSPQVNRELMSVIESLQRQTKEMGEKVGKEIKQISKRNKDGAASVSTRSNKDKQEDDDFA
ncbi:E3 ubiquitin protein ligase ORTHRUS 2-like protein [Tanacetum coccineum]